MEKNIPIFKIKIMHFLKLWYVIDHTIRIRTTSKCYISVLNFLLIKART